MRPDLANLGFVALKLSDLLSPEQFGQGFT
jgi:hypothetical protein